MSFSSWDTKALSLNGRQSPTQPSVRRMPIFSSSFNLSQISVAKGFAALPAGWKRRSSKDQSLQPHQMGWADGKHATNSQSCNFWKSGKRDPSADFFIRGGSVYRREIVSK